MTFIGGGKLDADKVQRLHEYNLWQCRDWIDCFGMLWAHKDCPLWRGNSGGRDAISEQRFVLRHGSRERRRCGKPEKHRAGAQVGHNNHESKLCSWLARRGKFDELYSVNGGNSLKQITNKEYEKYQKYLNDCASGRVLTPEGLRLICAAYDNDPEKIWIHMLEVLTQFRNGGIVD